MGQIRTITANETIRQPADMAEAGSGYGFATGQNPVWNLTQILQATGGTLVGSDGPPCFRAISTDSRTIEPGDLFVALAGDSFDGHQFVEQVVAKGAAGVIVSRDLDRLPPCVVVKVPDTLQALGDLAAYRRHQVQGLRVVAITGSCGKTTVKDMVAEILSSRFQIIKTMGNFNNLIGLPLSLLPVSFQHRFAVLEMGMNRPGEIRRLTEIADPDVACITTIAEAHLEGLGSVEKVARAKAELFETMGGEGILVVNADDPRIRKIAAGLDRRQISFGLRRGAHVRATHVRPRGRDGQDFTLHVAGARRRIRSRLLGLHNIVNSLAAAATCLALDVSMEQIAEGLSRFNPPDKRLRTEVLPCGIVMVNDAYNANPGSVRAALEAVKTARGKAKSVAVLGDMLELGAGAARLHEGIGKTVHDCGFDRLLTYGAFAERIVAGAVKAGMAAERAGAFADKKEMVRHLQGLIDSGRLSADDWILIKGSRGMRMEEVAERLLASPVKCCSEKNQAPRVTKRRKR